MKIEYKISYVITTMLVIISLALVFSCKIPKDRDSTYNNNALFVESVVEDLGVIDASKQDSASFNFKIRNISIENIELTKIEPSCSCVSIDSVQRILIPGQETIIHGKIGLKGSIGNFSKPIFINYGNEDLLLLRIRGVVR